jgi:hypothetical protein
MSRAAKPAQQLAYLTIGHSHFLLDASKAMKVAELMQNAVNAEWDYGYEGRERRYIAGASPEVEFRLVRSDQVRMPLGDPSPMVPAKPRLLR